MPTNSPSILIKKFNMDMLTNKFQSITLQNYMNKKEFKIFFLKNKTFNNT
jgi:hypothetical protein